MRASLRRPLALLVGAAIIVVIVTCTDSSLAPRPLSRGRAVLSMVPQFSANAQRAVAFYRDVDALTYDSVRVLIVRPPSETIKDTTVAFAEGQADLDLPLSVDATVGEQLTATLQYRSLSGVVLFSGNASVTAQAPNNPGSVPATVVTVNVDPGAPGAKTFSVTVSPPTGTTFSNTQQPQFTARTFALDGTEITPAAVQWSVDDPTVTISSSGVVQPGSKVGSLIVTATAISGASGQSVVTFFAPPTKIVTVSGGGQTGDVGSALPQPFVVEVQSASGTVANQSVTFASSGNGSVAPITVTTNSAGRAQTTPTLGSVPGSYTFTATNGALPSTSMSATATVAPAATITTASGSGQSDTVKKTLANPLVVLVVDNFGNPKSGVTVNWNRTGGSGAVSAATSTTGTDGRASVTYTLGSQPGTETVSASVSGVTAAATFTLTAVAGAPTALTVVSGNNQSGTVGTPLPNPLVVLAADAAGNPVNGAAIVWAVSSGGASLVSPQATTGADGHASTGVTLGSVPGPATITATAGTLSTSFTATGAIGAPAVLALVSGGGQTGVAGTALTTIAVKVTDAVGNPIAGDNVGFAVAIGGGSIALTNGGATDVNGIARATWTLGSLVGTQTITVTRGGLSGSPLTVSATATAAAAASLGFQVQPGNATASVTMAPAVVVRAVDQFGATVTGFSGNVTLAIGTNPSSGTLSGTLTVAAVNGVATFSTLSINNIGTGYTLTATAAGLTSVTSTAFNVVAAPATALQFQVQPSNTTATEPNTPVLVKIVNSLGAVVTSATNNVTIAIGTNPGTGVLSGTLTVAAVNGIATFSNLAIDDAGTGYMLSATATGLTSATSASFNVLAPTLAYQVQPSNVAATTVITPAVTVRALDQFGAVMTGFTGNITVAILANPGSATLGGTLTRAAVSGAATFNDLTLNAVGSGYTLTATSPALVSGTSAAFNVTAAPATLLQFQVQPSDRTAGLIIAPSVEVKVVDAQGGVVTSASNNITLAIGTNPASGTLGGTLTVAAVNGVATFSNLSINNSGAGYTLTATAAGLTSATSTAFTIAQPQLVFQAQPTNVAATTVMTPAVTVRVLDQGGAVMTGFTGNVTVAILNNPSNGILSGTVTQAAVAGVATFNDLKINAAGSGYTINATGTSLVGAVSNAFNVTAAPSTDLQFQVQPGNTTATEVIAPAVQVKIVNSLGAVVTSATNSVTIAIGTNPGIGIVSGTLTVAAVNGIATFSNLAIDDAGTGYTLSATAAGLTTATSTPFNVLAPTLSFQVQPSNVAATTVVTPAVTVRVLDQGGAVMTGMTPNVTVAIGTNPGSATLGGTLTRAAVAGVATFNDLTLTAVGTGYTLTAASPTLVSGTSAAFNVTAAPATMLQFQVQPPNGTAGLALTPAVQVKIVNGAGGLVTTASNSVTLTIGANPASGTLGGTVTVAAINGIATFSNLTLDNAGNGYTLAASAAGLTSATSGTFNIASAGPSGVAFQVQPASAAMGTPIAPAVQVRILNLQGATVTTATNAVTLSIANNPASGTLSGTVSVAAVNGIATFSNLTIDNIGNGYTLAALSTGLSSASSTPFNITAPANAVSWINPAGGSWSVGSNWSTGAVPTATDSVLIKQSGTYTVTVDQPATIRSLYVGGAGGSQTVTLPSQPLTINAASTLQPNTRLLVTGGTLAGAGTITTTGILDWQGGTLSGTGGLNVLSGGQLLISAAASKTLTNGYNLQLAGTGSWTGNGTIHTGNLSQLRVLAGGTLDLQGDGDFLFDQGGSSAFLSNQGTITRTVSSGTFGVSASVNNDGTISTQSGTLTLFGGGVNNGSFITPSGGTLEFGGGIHALTSGSSVSGTGIVRVSAGTLNAAGSWNTTGTTQVTGGVANFNNASMTTGSLAISGGTVGGTASGMMTVTGALAWSGGSFQGSNGTTRVANGASMAVTGSGSGRLLTAYNLEVGGAGTWATTTAAIGSGNNGILRVLGGGQLTVTGDFGILYNQGGAASHLVVYGTLQRTTSANPVAFSTVLDDSGTVNVQTGTLMADGGGISNGAFAVSSGATLQFDAGVSTLASASTVTGAGTVRTAGATLNVGGTWNVTGTTEVTSGTTNFGGATMSATTLNVAGGTLGGSGTLTVTGPMTWSGGSLSGGTGKTRVAPGGTLAVNGSGSGRILSAYSLELGGNGGWNVTTSAIGSGNGGVLRVLATGQLDIAGDFGMLYNQGGGPSHVVTYGALRRTTSTNPVQFSSTVDDSGSVNVLNGTLQIYNGGTSSGTYAVGSGGTLEFGGSGTNALAATSSVTGAGNVSVTGATVTTAGGWSVTGTTSVSGGTLNTDGTGSSTGFTLSTGGTKGGVGTFTVTGPLSWTGGNFSGGAGITRAQGSLTMGGGAASINNHTFEVAGVGTWTGTATISSGSGGIFRVASGGSLDIQGDPTFTFNQGGTTSQFVNQGVVNRNTSSGTAIFNVPFNTAGTVNINSGIIQLIDGGSLANTVAMSGSGQMILNGGTVTVTNGLSVTGSLPLTLLGGSIVGLTSPGDTARIATLTLVGGTLANSVGAIKVTALATWSGSTLSGGGTLTIPAGAVLLMSGTEARAMTNYTIDNFSNSMVWSSAFTLSSGSGAVIRNRPAGIFSIAAAGSYLFNQGGATSLLDNQGTLNFAAGGTFIHTAQFNNSGPMSVSSGTFDLRGGGTQSGTVSVGNSAFLDLDGGTHTLNNGFVESGLGMARVQSGTVTTGSVLDTAFFQQLQLNSGSLAQPGGVVVSQLLDWAGNTSVTGAGVTRLASGSLTLTGSGSRTLLNGTLENRGTASWSGTNSISSGSGAVIRNTNTGTFTVNSTLASYDFNQGGAQSAFINLGSLIISPGGGNSFTQSALLTNSSSVAVSSGTYNLTNGSTQTGPVTVSNGAILDLTGGTHTLNNGFAQTGAGTVVVDGGTVTTATALDTARFTSLLLNTGTLTQPGGMVASQSLVWSGSAQITGSGTTRLLSGGTFLMNGTASRVLLNGILENRGTGTWSGNFTVGSGSGAILRNATGANFALTGDGVYSYNEGGTQSRFDNLGSFVRNTSSNTVTWSAYFSSLVGATYSQTTGTLQLSGGSRFGGSPSVVAPAVLAFTGAGTIDSLVGGTSFASNGALLVNGATLTTDTASVGTVNVQNLTLTNGSIAHEGLLVVNTALTWNGGTISSNNAGTGGTTRVGSEATFTISTGNAKTMTGAHTLDLQGITNYDGTAGNISTGIGAIIQNSGTFNWQNASTIQYNEGGTQTVFRQTGGTLSHSAAGVGTLAALLNWTGGSLSVATGTLNLTGGSGTSFAGSTSIASGAILRVSQTSVTLTGNMTASGTGTIDVNGASLALGGHKLYTAGTFSTSGSGVLTMVNTNDTLTVANDIIFGGGSTVGPNTLTAGRIRVGGNFSQSGSTTAYAPTGTHSVLLNGSGSQGISFANPTTSFFNKLEISGSNLGRTIPLQTNVIVADSLCMRGGEVGAQLIGTGGGSQRLSANGKVIVGSNSSRLAPPVLELTANFDPNDIRENDAPYGLNADTTLFKGGTEFPTGSGLNYKSVNIATGALMTFDREGSPAPLAGDLEISSGTFAMASFGTFEVSGNLRTTSTGKLRMQFPYGELAIDGSATFAGGSTAGELTNGTLRIAGAFTQSGGNSAAFQASGSHTTQLADSVNANFQGIRFDNPGTSATTSRFSRLKLYSDTDRPVNVELLSDVQAGMFYVPETEGNDTVYTSTITNAKLTTDTIDVANMVFKRTRLAVTAPGGDDMIYGLTFDSMDPTQTWLHLDRKQYSSLELDDLNFTALPILGGLILEVNQTNSGSAAQVSVSSDSPPFGIGGACAYVSAIHAVGVTQTPVIYWNGRNCANEGGDLRRGGGGGGGGGTPTGPPPTLPPGVGVLKPR